ncbi:MAG TPA: winged helix-turn-helix domain-containing protein [Gaiellaceae bacterium]|nr:winged helix-turn-helix domain-containing protein [Gaiellaceae bacterium]
MSDPEQLRALGGQLRARIVQLLRERAASTTELATALGVAKGTVAHHLKVLERVGLIRVVATRRVRAVTERYYGRVARLYVLKSDESPPGAIGTGGLTAVMLHQAADEVPRNASYSGTTASLTHAKLKPADVRRISKRMNALVAAFQAADDPDGEPYGLALASYPSPASLPPPDA